MKITSLSKVNLMLSNIAHIPQKDNELEDEEMQSLFLSQDQVSDIILANMENYLTVKEKITTQ